MKSVILHFLKHCMYAYLSRCSTIRQVLGSKSLHPLRMLDPSLQVSIRLLLRKIVNHTYWTSPYIVSINSLNHGHFVLTLLSTFSFAIFFLQLICTIYLYTCSLILIVSTSYYSISSSRVTKLRRNIKRHSEITISLSSLHYLIHAFTCLLLYCLFMLCSCVTMLAQQMLLCYKMLL